MSVPKSRSWIREHVLPVALPWVAILTLWAAARAGHEVPYYPAFYPQEIRIEPLDAETAARELSSTTDPLHVYFGSAPLFASDRPGHLASAMSLRALITVSVNPRSPRVQGREARCRAAGRAGAALKAHPDVVAHPYPITPYHADYLGHVDLVAEAKPAADEVPPLTFRADNAGIESLLSLPVEVDPSEWDLHLDEVSVNELIRPAGIGSTLWPAAPWVKEGWFQAYHLLRPTVSDPAERERADAIYARLTHGEVNQQTERLDLERELVAALTRGCERTVIGYRLRREFYNDDFSNGVENIAVDSQSGFNSPIFVRTIKLKDFPWNGWLRVGIDTRPTAAWNPVAGFTDAPGRLVWATVGDDAFLPTPYNSGWVQNRAEIQTDSGAATRQSQRIPADAVLPQPGTGEIRKVGPGQGAMTKVTYRVSASAFHDGSEMEPADLLFPYALAYRWGAGQANGAVFDPAIAAATQLIRERLRGVRILRVEERTLAIADLSFTYRSPIVEVYLDNLSPDALESALLAPPWSSVPWHVLALMGAAVERGVGAFSQQEAERRRVPWLDLVRDPAQLATLRMLIQEFARTGYRPAALAGLVNPEAAKARWQALDRFVEANNHLLVTNGAYRLTSWSPEAFVFAVVREFTYPVGLGTFNVYAYPPRAIITGIERAGDRILVAADVEMAIKQQRDHRLVRKPLTRDTLRDTFPIRPVPRYAVIGQDGKAAAAGLASRTPDGRFAVSLPPTLAPGNYTFVAAIFADGNTIDPAIGRISFRIN